MIGCSGPHDEWEADEHQHQHDRQARVSRFDPQRHEKPPEPAVGDVEIREDQPRDRGRQCERQIDERIDEPLAGKLVADQHPGDEKTEHRTHERRDKRCTEGKGVSRASALGPDGGSELFPRQPRCRATQTPSGRITSTLR